MLVGLVGALSAGCSRGDDPDLGQVADLRSRQARSAAAEAGLPAELQAFVARAARAPAATFSATYASGADRLVVHQVPPRRRIDVVRGGAAVEAVVAGPEGSVHCRRASPARADRWICDEGDRATAAGAFSPELVARTVEALRDGAAAYRSTVTDRTVGTVPATCLTSLPVAEGGAPSELCVSRDGVPLLLDRGDGSPILRAIRYEASASAGDVRRPDR